MNTKTSMNLNYGFTNFENWYLTEKEISDEIIMNGPKRQKMLQTLKKWHTVKQPKIVVKKYLHSVSNCVSDSFKQQQSEIISEGASFFLQTKDVLHKNIQFCMEKKSRFRKPRFENKLWKFVFNSGKLKKNLASFFGYW